MEGNRVVKKLELKDLQGKGEFAFPWLIGNSPLDKEKRRHLRCAILKYNVVEQCKELRKYVPTAEEPSASCVLGKIATLVKGMSLIVSYKVYHWLNEAVFKIKITQEKRRVAKKVAKAKVLVNVHGTTADSPDELQLQVQISGLTAVAVAEVSVAELESFVDVEVPSIQAKQRRPAPSRAAKKAQSETQILRMLSVKSAALNPMANIMNETTLSEQPRMDGDGFYDNTGVDPVVDSQELLNMFHEDISRVRTTPIRDTVVLVERLAKDRAVREARRLSQRSPIPNIQPIQPRRVTRPSVQRQEQNSMQLEPLSNGLRPRRRRSRRLVFVDNETTISSSVIRMEIQNANSDIEHLIELAERRRAVLPRVIEASRRGMDVIERAGRIIIGKALKKMVASNQTQLPMTEDVRESLRAEAASMISQPSLGVIEVAEVGEPSNLLLPLEATGSVNADSRMEEDISTVNIGTSILQPAGVNETAIEISHIASPSRRLSFSINNNNAFNLENILPFGSPVLTEEKLLTFDDVFPPNNVNTKRDAAHLFLTLLKHHKNHNVELIQTKFYGPIKIKVLQPEFNSSED